MTPGPIDEETVAALRAAVMVLARRLRYQLAGDQLDGGDDLSATELAVLGRVGRCGPMTPGQLARAEHVRPPSMTKVIESLEGRGLLRRELHPTDGRQYLVSRTEAAEAFVEASRKLRTAWLADHVGKLSETDQQAIAAATAALGRLAELP
jgi:DNA-binding MarR family transcriptional regulator